jgi:hypothetical protein
MLAERAGGVVSGERASATDLDDAFGLVANELRLDVLRGLWEADETPLSFSALQSRVGVSDSGKFNYHLNVLVPEFVRKSEKGYDLTHAGRRTIGAAVSGSFTEAAAVAVGPVPAGECFRCDGTTAVRYEAGTATVDCPDCDTLITRMPVPPVTVASVDASALPGVVSSHVRTLTTQLTRGFCKLCRGRVDATLTALSPEESVTYRPALNVRFECRACGDITNLNVGAVVLDHPAVISFLFDAGIDVRTRPIWELTAVLDPDERISSEDPLRLTLLIEVGGDVLALEVDGAATVVAHERRRGGRRQP